MKQALLIALLVVSGVALADDDEDGYRQVIGDDGSRHYERGDNSGGYGYSNGNEREQSRGFNDTQNGDRYEQINPSQYINTRTGQVVNR